MSDKKLLPIGVFDSGVGGISVLANLLQCLPGESFVYYADSLNAPYGLRPLEEVRTLSLQVVDFLLKQGIKGLVVACNTATSVVVRELRKTLDIPVIGMEPALKPAVELTPGGHIVVMATPLTLSQEKFHNLLHRFEDQANILPLPCPDLSDLIEEGHTADSEIDDYLVRLFAPFDRSKISAVVLGCTHYVFIRAAVQKLLGPGAQVLDGNRGTARHVANTLAAAGLLQSPGAGKQLSQVEYHTSGDPTKVIPLCESLLQLALSTCNSEE
ncbi:MAG TPA: glutamate racemase [Bacillota bacterium]|nr:glutamate racemase [Bacillota bacterium]